MLNFVCVCETRIFCVSKIEEEKKEKRFVKKNKNAKKLLKKNFKIRKFQEKKKKQKFSSIKILSTVPKLWRMRYYKGD